MAEKYMQSLLRRQFLTRLSGAVTGLGGALALGTRSARAQSAGGENWKPARHAEDDWLDQLPGVHRFILDNTTAAGFGAALPYANNFIEVNKNAYGLKNDDLAVVVVARHFSTSFALNDRMWAKYGTTLAGRENFTDPKTNTAPTVNVFNTSGYGRELPNRGMTLDSLFEKGLQLAVCQVATRGLAGIVAQASGANIDDIYEEFTDNLVDNAHLTPAGIVVIARAQERGYAFSFVA
jgi:intracellular sulfur oxidation DsrE/DsrF family protein